MQSSLERRRIALERWATFLWADTKADTFWVNPSTEVLHVKTCSSAKAHVWARLRGTQSRQVSSWEDVLKSKVCMECNTGSSNVLKNAGNIYERVSQTFTNLDAFDASAATKNEEEVYKDAANLLCHLLFSYLSVPYSMKSLKEGEKHIGYLINELQPYAKNAYDAVETKELWDTGEIVISRLKVYRHSALSFMNAEEEATRIGGVIARGAKAGKGRILVLRTPKHSIDHMLSEYAKSSVPDARVDNSEFWETVLALITDEMSLAEAVSTAKALTQL